MKKTGFYIPNRKAVEIKTIKKEEKNETEKLKSSKQRPDIKLVLPKVENEKEL
jgi:hypothetical protein